MVIQHSTEADQPFNPGSARIENREIHDAFRSANLQIDHTSVGAFVRCRDTQSPFALQLESHPVENPWRAYYLISEARRSLGLESSQPVLVTTLSTDLDPKVHQWALDSLSSSALGNKSNTYSIPNDTERSEGRGFTSYFTADIYPEGNAIILRPANPHTEYPARIGTATAPITEVDMYSSRVCTFTEIGEVLSPEMVQYVETYLDFGLGGLNSKDPLKRQEETETLLRLLSHVRLDPESAILVATTALRNVDYYMNSRGADPFWSINLPFNYNVAVLCCRNITGVLPQTVDEAGQNITQKLSMAGEDEVSSKIANLRSLIGK